MDIKLKIKELSIHFDVGPLKASLATRNGEEIEAALLAAVIELEKQILPQLGLRRTEAFDAIRELPPLSPQAARRLGQADLDQLMGGIVQHIVAFCLKVLNCNCPDCLALRQNPAEN